MLPHGIGNVCAAVTGDGGRDGREGPSKHWSEWDISRFCAVLIMDHEATQTPPIGRCHTATLPNMQPSAPCKYHPTVQVYKTMSPHQRQQCHPQKHPPESSHHLDVNQAQLMLQLGQVLRYAMLCIFPDLPRCVVSVIVFKTIDFATTLQFSGFAHVPLGY